MPDQEVFIHHLAEIKLMHSLNTTFLSSVPSLFKILFMRCFLFSFLVTLLAGSPIQAQIPNAGFETMNADSTIAYWGSNCAYAIGLGDSIISDGPFLSLSGQSYAGQYAMELRNAYNFTTAETYSSCAHSFNDSIVFGFNLQFPVSGYPGALKLYYRFSQNPMNDTAWSRVRIYNSQHYQIGEGDAVYSGAPAPYQLKLVPIQYITSISPSDGDLIPAFAEIDFRSSKDASQAHPGTRILFDELSFEAATGLEQHSIANSLAVFPNPASTSLQWDASLPVQSVRLQNSVGQWLQVKQTQPHTLSLQDLPDGFYVLSLTTMDGTNYRASFLKE